MMKKRGQWAGTTIYEDKMRFPFICKCIKERRISPLKRGEIIEVVGVAPEEDCENEMFTEIKWKGAHPRCSLSQLEGIGVDEETREALTTGTIGPAEATSLENVPVYAARKLRSGKNGCHNQDTLSAALLKDYEENGGKHKK